MKDYAKMPPVKIVYENDSVDIYILYLCVGLICGYCLGVIL
jgi:hypothetical protein